MFFPSGICISFAMGPVRLFASAEYLVMFDDSSVVTG